LRDERLVNVDVGDHGTIVHAMYKKTTFAMRS
jgi:hypothetical protein